MVSDAGKNYLIGNILAGPGQWQKMYVTGAGVTTLIKLSLIYIGLYPGLMSGSETALANYIIEIVNCLIPLVAVAMAQPLNAGLTLVSNILLGGLIWTLNYEASGGGF